MSTVRHLREAGVVPPGFRVAGFTQSMDSPSADTCVALMKEALASAITHGHLQLNEYSMRCAWPNTALSVPDAYA